MPSPEFDLIDGIFCKLADRESSDGPGSISEIEQVVLLVWHAEGIIGDGGFHYFLERGLPLRETAEAYQRLGVETSATALFGLLSLFGGHVFPDDWSECMSIFERFAKQEPGMLDRWERSVFAAAPLTIQQLDGWIRVHADVFHVTPSA